MKNTRKCVHTSKAPEPIGPYSQAVWAGDTLYISGQIGLDPDSGDLVDESLEDETNRMMWNVKAILEKAGLNLGHVVKCTIWLANMGDFGRINEAYGAFFPEQPPAREAIEISKLPKGANVEISVVAIA